ncbi:hypothetical protein LSTR_LSTR004461 [Laodelphax striatellus]|uniref:Uncharacterized protein n=1 Tax=Laodelphax striatellus TaxID=195883 RepID=A0A482XF33_LAOST|nr:hypothetical protein LSTR_LSTR004461 [Laodelphax striatellus]
MENRKTKKRPSHRMEYDNKSKNKDVSEKYSESLIALNESSFKIRRFMNDVSSFKENPSTTTKKTRHGFKSRDKENVSSKSNHAAKKAKNIQETRGNGNSDTKTKFAFQGKKGLFENGVATKTRTFCRGLMPPIWNARLNADLRSILNLSCVDAPKRHATPPTVAEPIDDAFESLRSRSPDATVINSRLVEVVQKKKLSPKRLKKQQLQSIFNDTDDDDESLVHASCSQVGGVVEAAADSEVQAGRAVSEDAASATGAKSEAVNISDHYLRFTHCIIKSLSSTRFDREQLESTSEKPVRFLAKFYRERLAQALDEPSGEVDSPPLVSRGNSQDKENEQRSQPTFSQPTQYGANTIRSDEWPRISRMKAKADEHFLDDVGKNKIYTSGLKLLEAVYGQNNETDHHKAYNNLSVTPPKCLFSPIAEDISSNASFVNPVSGKKDWLPDFKGFSPPEAKSSTCCRSNDVSDCDFMNCTDESCRNNVINYDFMTCGDQSRDKTCDFSSGRSRGCWGGNSCLLNCTTVSNSGGHLDETLGRSSRSITAVTTADCLTILPPKSSRLERRRTSGLHTELRNKVEDSADYTKDLLTIPLHLPARDSPDIQYYPRRMF